MTKIDLNYIVQLLEDTDSAHGLAWEDALGTCELWSPLDRDRLPELVGLLQRPSPWVIGYALTSIRRIGGNLDPYLETICARTQATKARGVSNGIAAEINGEIAAIVRTSILAGSVAARRYGEQFVWEKTVSWFDRLRIRRALRHQKQS